MNYDGFLELVKYRRSIRRFKPDPIPEDYIIKILDAAHYAMSGGNSQPWEFIIIKDPAVKKRVFEIKAKEFEIEWALEQQRTPLYRHPAFNLSPEEKEKSWGMLVGWADAPVYIAVLADPRKQWGSVIAAHGSLFYSSCRNVLSATLGHLSMTIHLAAAALGLGSQRVDVCTEQGYKEALGYPEPLRMDILVPVGYRAYEPGSPHRLPLEELIHYDHYDMEKFLTNDDFLSYLERIRNLGRPGYRVAIGEDKG